MSDSLECYMKYLTPRKDSKFILSKLKVEKMAHYKKTGSVIWPILCNPQLDSITVGESQFVELGYAVRSIVAKYAGDEDESRYFFKQSYSAIKCQTGQQSEYSLVTYLYLVISSFR